MSNKNDAMNNFQDAINKSSKKEEENKKAEEQKRKKQEQQEEFERKRKQNTPTKTEETTQEDDTRPQTEEEKEAQKAEDARHYNIYDDDDEDEGENNTAPNNPINRRKNNDNDNNDNDNDNTDQDNGTDNATDSSTDKIDTDNTDNTDNTNNIDDSEKSSGSSSKDRSTQSDGTSSSEQGGSNSTSPDGGTNTSGGNGANTASRNTGSGTASGAEATTRAAAGAGTAEAGGAATAKATLGTAIKKIVKKIINLLGGLELWMAILIIALVIIAVIIVIGYAGFFINGVGLIREKLGKFADTIWTGFTGFFVGSDVTQVKDEQIYDVAQYLENMGYDLVYSGFLDTNGKAVTKEVNEDGSETIKSGNKIIYQTKLNEETGKVEISKLESKYIKAYLAAENNTYMIANQHWTFTDIFFTPIADMDEWGTGMIHLENASSKVKIDRENKKMQIKYKGYVYQYDLDGWTGRYREILRISINSTYSNTSTRFCV